MPVKVKIEDKERLRVAADAPPPAQLSDYAAPGERSEGLKAFFIWCAIMLMICGLPFGHPATQPIAMGLTAWWIGSIFVYYVLVPRMVLRRLRLHGPEFEITTKKSPRLKAVLAKGSAMLGVTEPEGFISDEVVPQVRLMGRKDPYFFMATKGAAESLAPPELDCLALRTLVHASQRHTARLMLIEFVAKTPVAVRLLVWPIGFYSSLLQMSWLELANQTGDRLTLLLVKDHKLLLRGILKMHAFSDPIMNEAEVTPEDVEEYVNQAGRISVEGKEISTQYKIGTAISANPFLDERIQNLNEWARSQEFQDALQKLAESRAKNAPAPRPT